ncbi:MFS transporter [Nocardiopsis xinjiangensis]|uniref:MFS transporter n=1 Tax=Nocardiopsis xinjiangensis TaxID=124285 RepID=UPI00034B2CB7|nr:MFS transporter [Nocardiopsis xinjiangensis]
MHMPRSSVRYLIGAAWARTGEEMSGPALLLLGLSATGSISTGSTLWAALTATSALGGPLVGLALDRSARPARLLAWLLALYAFGLVALTLVLGSALPLGWAVATALVLGVLGPVLSGGWTAQLPALVRSDRLEHITTWDAMTFGAAALIGPALAAAVAAGAGPWVAVWASAGALVLAAALARSLPVVGHVKEQGRVGAQLLAGAAVCLRSPPLLRATAVTSLSLAGTGMVVVCVPMLGERFLGAAAHGAWLLSVMAVCSLLANLVLSRRTCAPSPGALILVCVLAQAAGTALVAVAPSWVGMAVAALVLGAAEGPQLTALFSVRHRHAPGHLRAQVFTVGASLKISAFALGAAVAGPLVERSVMLCLAVAAGVHLLAALTHGVLSLRRPGSGAVTGV